MLHCLVLWRPEGMGGYKSSSAAPERGSSRKPTSRMILRDFDSLHDSRPAPRLVETMSPCEDSCPPVETI
ncbi:hypothetical protein BD779DRAFT_1501618 [Infundibulicybe gibba]|nr:hypothetical protein BD779DRAFT_1501618 [Infundibulicybe gibba]